MKSRREIPAYAGMTGGVWDMTGMGAGHDRRGQGKRPPRLEEHLHYHKGMRRGLNAAAKSLIYYVIQYDTK